MRNNPKGMAMPCREFYLTLFTLFIFSGFSLQAQWPSSGNNIYNSNTGNVGVGTSTPNFLLDVNGGFGVAGPNSNLDPAHTYQSILTTLQNSGKMMIGWNRQAGSGETDFIANSGGGYPGGFAFWNYTNGGVLSPLLYLNALGYVGINTTAPAFPLDVYGGWAVMRQGVWGQATSPLAASGYFTGATNNPGAIILQGSGGTWPAWWISGASGLLQIGGNGGTQPSSGVLNITTTGNVLIGKTSQTNSGYMLDINGNTRTNEVVVNTTGADYVFEPGYHLSPLKELETYVHQQHHLPGIAPAVKMQQEGINLGDNQTQLLAKIEELTLYLIQQDKETQALKEKIKTLEERNHTLENIEQRIERLEHSGNTVNR